MVSYFLFALSASSGVVILCFSLIDRFQFWPPPGKRTWQHRTMLALFRVFVYALLVLTVVEFEPLTGMQAIVQYGLGGVLFLTGFGLAIAITLGMGWRNAFGEKKGLKTTGWFAWSRNPIYVVTWIGLIGWGLIANNLLVSILLASWALLYLLAPFREEPWLEQQYGEEYRTYKQTVRRFI